MYNQLHIIWLIPQSLIYYWDLVDFSTHPELLDALVRVHFHSNLKKYNRIECWGPLKDAVEGRQGDHTKGITALMDSSHPRDKQRAPKSIFQVIFAFLL
ncbi:hypothetical protein CerSpe_268000 [Prunus speciosa]